jgi:hypothetical protein
MLMATIVAALVVLALALPASARPAGSDSAATVAAVAASVPNCVVTDLDDSGYTDYLTVFNGCNYAVRVKVVLAFHTDKPCATIGAHSIRSYSWKYPGRFDGLVSC